MVLQMAQDPVESSFKDLAQRSYDQFIESYKILHLISYQIRTIKILCRISTMDALYKGWSVLSLGGEVLPLVGSAGRLRPKGVPFVSLQYIEG